MGLGCQITRNKSGKIQEVRGFNKAKSKLYSSIVNEHPELTEDEALRHYAKFYTPTFRKTFGDFVEGESVLDIDVNGEPIYNQDKLNKFRLSNKLESGFLKDFNITVDEFQAIHDNLKKTKSSSDFLNKVIETPNRTDITKEAVFFAYTMLGKANGKLKADIKYTIHGWNKYDEKFELYKKQINDAYGFMPEEKIWFNKVRDQIIIDFLAEELVDMYNNPKSFEEVGREEFTKEDWFKLNPQDVIGRFLKWIREFFAKFGNQSPLQQRIRLTNSAINIAHEMLNQEYRIFNYDLSADQLKTEYDETVNKNPTAKRIINSARNLGLYLTGSLALRAQGDVYRTVDESVHDLDFTVPFSKSLEEKILLDKLLGYQGPNDFILAEAAIKIIPEYTWFKSFKKQFPDFTFTNAFVSDKKIIALQGVINGEFYKSKVTVIEKDKNGKDIKVNYKKGDHIKGTGIDIDFFIEIKPTDYTNTKDNFLHWKSIFLAKMNIGARNKDIVDLKHFVPFIEDSNNNVSTPLLSYTRDLSIIDKPTINGKFESLSLEDSETGSYAYEDYNTAEELAEATALKYNSKIVNEQLRSLSDQLNTPYEVISEREAKIITEDALNPYSGEPAFYFNNKVYFVGGMITSETAFHEFSHPLVRYIKTVNKPLFEKLFKTTIETEEGDRIYNESMREYFKIEDKGVVDAIKEEVIVKGLTLEAISQAAGIATSKEFKNIISKWLYHIKQYLRKIFGSAVKVEKLGLNTSLNDLAKLLVKGDKFNVETDLIEPSDIVSYIQQREDFQNDLQNLIRKDKEQLLGDMVDNMSQAVAQMQSMVSNNKGFDAMRNALASESGSGYLSDMLRGIIDYSREKEALPDNQRLIEGLEKAEYLTKKANALINNVISMEHMANSIKKHLDSIYNDPDQQETMKQMYQYNQLIESWQKWLKMGENQLRNFQADEGTGTLRSLLSSIRNVLDQIDKVILDKYAEGVSEVIHIANPMNKVLEKNHKYEVARLENIIENSSGNIKESYKKILEQENEKYDRNYLSDEKLKLLLAGATKTDNHLANAWLVNYISNPDPIVGSFGKFLKDAYSDVQSITHSKYNTFVNDMDDVLRRYGYNRTNFMSMSQDLLFEDETGFIDPETGKFEVYKVKTFKNDFQNYKRDLIKYTYYANKAKENWKQKGTKEAENAYVEITAKTDKYMQTFFNSKYVDDFYKKDEVLLNTVVNINGKDVNVGEIAKLRVDTILSTIKDIDARTKYKDPIESLESAEEKKIYWREYSQLFSTKIGAKDKKGLDLEVAKALKIWREKKNKFYEWKPIAGAFDTALEAAEAIINVKLKNLGVEEEQYEEEYNKLRDLWLDGNTRIKLKDSFYAERGRILNLIKGILDTLEEKRLSADAKFQTEPITRFEDKWYNINETISGKRDDDGQPVGSEMDDESIAYIKTQQEDMIKAKSEFVKLSGLTEEEGAEMQYFYERMKTKNPRTGRNIRLNEADQNRFNFLRAKKGALGLDSILKSKLLEAFTDLESLQSKIPTEYYIADANVFYEDFMKADLGEDSPVEMTVGMAKQLLKPEVADKYKKMNADFKEWFDQNHVLTSKWDNILMARVPIYERVHVWSVIRPNDPNYFEQTEVIKEDGTTEIIEGVPTLQYFYRSVKPEHMTGYNKKTGNVDLNNYKDAQGKWLPRTEEEMNKKFSEDPEYFKTLTDDDGKPISHLQYINTEYKKLKQEGGVKLELLNKFKAYTEEHEKELSPTQKMGNELGRYRKTNYDYIREGTLSEKSYAGRLYSILKGIGAQWTSTKDNLEEDISFEDDWAVTNALNTFRPDAKIIPITGKYKLEIDQVSNNIMESMMKRMFSIEQHNMLSKTQPVAHAFKKLINELNPEDVLDIQKKLAPQEPLIMKPNKGNRSQAVNALYDTWWEGQKTYIKKSGKSQATGHKVVKSLLGLASHSFFALDIPSALKNYYGAQFQLGMEALVGKTYIDDNGVRKNYITYDNALKARLWAVDVNREISQNIYTRTSKPLMLQLLEVMDPIQGRQADKFGESPGRSLASDVASFTWLTSSRKWLENLATLESYGAMMKTVKVTQTLDGVPTEIDYLDAWQLNEETQQIELKPGISKEWGIGGTKFKTWKNRFHEISGFNQGLYAEMDMPMANRYLTFKVFVSMRKFFTKMFLNRWSAKNATIGNIIRPSRWHLMEEKWNPALEDYHMGYFMRTAKTLSKIAQSKGSYLGNMNSEEKNAALRVMLEPIKVYMFQMLVTMLFGLWDWDPDDKDKWKKMRKRSGALPMGFLTDDEYEKDWHLGGWIQNHALLTMLNVHQENTFFFRPDKQSDLLSPTSIMTGATFDTYFDLIGNIYGGITNSPDSFYKKDTGGALFYQQADDWKGWKQLSRMIGLKGKFADPAKSAENFYHYNK
jgi:hypothetical protein